MIPSDDKELPARQIPARMEMTRECTERVPMHPDDFQAHLAWVKARLNDTPKERS